MSYVACDVLRGWLISHVEMVKNLGGVVRELRTSLGLTQKALADKAGITDVHLSRIECGLVIPSYDVIGRIIEAAND